MNLLHCIGVGTVARNKQTNSKICYVHLPGYFPAGDGEISGEASVSEVTGLSKDGTQNSSKALKTNVFPASWMNMGNTNRLSPPDVRVGSQVAIYRWGDDQKLYWTTWGFGGDTMRLETVVHGWSANPNTSESNEFDYSNFYTFEVSTHTGRVAFRTAQANGEKTTHEIAINAKTGSFSVADGEGNLLAVDAANHSFAFQNQEKSKLFINRKQILMSCEDKMMLSATNNFTLNAKEIGIKATKMTVVCDTTNIKGDVNMLGNLTMKGNINATGGMKITGGINATQDIVAGGISVMKHVHPGVKEGGDLSDPPKA